MPDLVIELDRHEETEELISSRRSWPGRARHMWIAAGLAVACLLALGSGGRPSPAVRLVADIKIHQAGELMAIAGEILIEEPGTLAALDSRTAEPRWRVQTGMNRHLIRHEGDLVLVTGAVEGTASQVRSLAVDLATGEVRWQLPGLVTVAGGLVVSHVAERPVPNSPGRLTVYSTDGRTVWSKEPVSQLHAVDPKRQTVLVLDRLLGELVEYRIDDGGLVGRTVLPELANALGIHRLNGEIVVFFPEGRLLRRQGSEFVVDSGFPNGDPEQTDCGTLWCVHTPGLFAITLVDKATGRPVDAGGAWELAIHTEGGIVGIGQSYGVQDRRAVSLFDPVTRRAQPLRGWFPVGQRIDDRVVSWRGPLILTSAAPSRTFFAVLESTGMRVVGSVPYDHLDRCAATSYLVACRVDPETVKVWQPS